jgi:large subunit ribosomal protein L18
MNQQAKKIVRRLRRKRHIRRTLSGTAVKPRLSVFRSHQNISCQLIDDSRGVTLAASSSLRKELKGQLGGKGGNRQAATLVGKDIAEKAKGLGISAVAFDRNGYRFHGRVKALAEAAREAGLKF